MNITSVKYISNEDIKNYALRAIIDGDVVFVPIEVGNRHYDAIQEWVSKGNTIEESD
tara:strand:- start:426 stop:596 length:171 start_codon:yes stop_codon:yes gene_type:complete